MTRRVCLLLMIVAILIPLSAGGQAGRTAPATKIAATLRLDWVPGPHHVGPILAAQRGYYADEGIDLTVAPFFDREFFELVYRPGQTGRKAMRFLRQAAGRLRTVWQHGRYDMMVIYREALPVGPPIVESLLAGAKVPLVYDFDDAVFLSNTSDANRWVAALKHPQKTGAIIRRCDQVIAGNLQPVTDALIDYDRQQLRDQMGGLD